MQPEQLNLQQRRPDKVKLFSCNVHGVVTRKATKAKQKQQKIPKCKDVHM